MSTELSTSKQRILERLFRGFNSDDLKYVILRRYEQLPKVIPGRDIDIFIEAAEFHRAIEICEGLGFDQESNDRTILSGARLVVKGLQKPTRTAEILRNSPHSVEDAFGIQLPDRISPSRNMDPYDYATKGKFDDLEYVMTGHGIKLDLKPHISYESPLGGKQIRVHPKVEKRMLDRRRQRGLFYVASPPDELAHVLAHVIFDYQGDIPEYYRSRCVELSETVINDEEYDEQFRELLKLMFFDADDKVYDFCRSQCFENMFTELKTYRDY